MSLTRQQKIQKAIRKAFCVEGESEPSLDLLAQEAFRRTWANLGDEDDGDRFSPAEVYQQLMELTRGRNGAPPIIQTLYYGARLQWVRENNNATGRRGR